MLACHDLHATICMPVRAAGCEHRAGRADGGISIWNPLRGNQPTEAFPNPMPCLHFGQSHSAHGESTGHTLWEGLLDSQGSSICRGLIHDAVHWPQSQPETFAQLQHLLKILSPSPQEQIQLDKAKNLIGTDDSRLHPRLRFPHGSIYAVQASMAVKRMLGLAYALAWSRLDLQESALQTNTPLPGGAVLLIDELEAHLHPQWQRSILDSVLSAAQQYLPGTIQMILTTNSALIIASAEALFDQKADALFHFGTSKSGTSAEKVQFTRHGEADSWLTSPIFGLSSTRSTRAEEILKRAADAMNKREMSREMAKAIDDELRETLSERDPFWTRWRDIAEKRGWIP